MSSSTTSSSVAVLQVNVLGEVAPQISMTVTPLSALLSLRVSYVITLLSCFLFLFLVFLHHTHLRKADKQVLTGKINISTFLFLLLVFLRHTHTCVKPTNRC